MGEPLMQFWVSLSEIIRNVGLVIAGAIGIYLAWKRVLASNRQADAQWRQAELSRRVHVTDRFNRAVGQLKDEKTEIRLGAILTLGQICKEFRDLSDPVMQLPAAYLKQQKNNTVRPTRLQISQRSSASSLWCHEPVGEET